MKNNKNYMYRDSFVTFFIVIMLLSLQTIHIKNSMVFVSCFLHGPHAHSKAFFKYIILQNVLYYTTVVCPDILGSNYAFIAVLFVDLSKYTCESFVNCDVKL